MEKLPLAELKPGVRLTRPLFHASGEVLLEAGSVVTSGAIHLMAEAGIETVLQRGRGEDAQEFLLAIRNEVLPVSHLKTGLRMEMPIYDREGLLLAPAGTQLTRQMISKIRRRREPRVYARKPVDDLERRQLETFRKALARLDNVRPAAIREQMDPARMIPAEECTARRVAELLEYGEPAAVPPGPAPLAAELRAHHPLEPRPSLTRYAYLAVYEEALGQMTALLRAFELGKDLDERPVGEVARALIGALIADRELLLGLHRLEPEGGYLPGHCLGVTVLAIAAAAARGYDQQQVLELAYAALLHDVGMLRVPAGIVNRPRQLSRMEMVQIRKHPAHSLDLLQHLTDRRGELARSIPIVAYQSHERENGSGYPQGASSGAIHDFARLLAVCDVYQALACRRPWRERLLPYHAMEQVVLMGKRHELDPRAIRALLSCVSLFPIGSWVELSDGSRARVVAAGEKDFARPVVSIMYRGAERLDMPLRLDLTEHREIDIANPIAPPEDISGIMDGF